MTLTFDALKELEEAMTLTFDALKEAMTLTFDALKKEAMTLTFDALKHEYHLDGVRLPSVSQIIAPLRDFSAVDPDILQRAADFGTAAHRACELWDKGKLDEAGLDPNLRPYLDGWIRFKRECGFVSIANESRVFSKRWGYAGTLDTVGWIRSRRNRDVLAVADIKTGTLAPDGAAAVQLAAYQQAWNEMVIPPMRAHHRISVWLRGAGKYRLDWWKDKTDWLEFRRLLKKWKEEKGGEENVSQDSTQDEEK